MLNCRKAVLCLIGLSLANYGISNKEGCRIDYYVEFMDCYFNDTFIGSGVYCPYFNCDEEITASTTTTTTTTTRRTTGTTTTTRTTQQTTTTTQQTTTTTGRTITTGSTNAAVSCPTVDMDICFAFCKQLGEELKRFANLTAVEDVEEENPVEEIAEEGMINAIDDSGNLNSTDEAPNYPDYVYDEELRNGTGLYMEAQGVKTKDQAISLDTFTTDCAGVPIYAWLLIGAALPLIMGLLGPIIWLLCKCRRRTRRSPNQEEPQDDPNSFELQVLNNN